MPVPASPSLQGVIRRLIGHHRDGGPEGTSLLDQLIHIAMRGERLDLEQIRMASQNIQVLQPIDPVDPSTLTRGSCTQGPWPASNR